MLLTESWKALIPIPKEKKKREAKPKAEKEPKEPKAKKAPKKGASVTISQEPVMVNMNN